MRAVWTQHAITDGQARRALGIGPGEPFPFARKSPSYAPAPAYTWLLDATQHTRLGENKSLKDHLPSRWGR